MQKRRWTHEQLVEAVRNVKSIRQLLLQLGIFGCGGNYPTIKRYLLLYQIDISHFTGQGWRTGTKVPIKAAAPLQNILVTGSGYQSFKLKRRLFAAGIKTRHCEECGWAKISDDGRMPLELDHINGDRYDNRLENLRILCPNCHSLKSTHRGRNKGVSRGGATGQTQDT